MDIETLLVRFPLWYGVFLFSLTCHEAAHALAARRGGDDTAYAGGQATLDPLPHIRRERLGMVVVPILSYFLQEGRFMFGWASAPFDPYWSARHPRRAAAMAFAGPSANLALTALSTAGLKFMLFHEWVRTQGNASLVRDMPFMFEADGAAAEIAAAALALGLFLNLLLAVLNLMPFPPFHGTALPGLFLTHEGRMKYARLGREYHFLGLVAGWMATSWVLDRLFPPLERWLFSVSLAG